MPELKLEELRNIQAETCKTFGNPKRLLIIESLWDAELSYSQLQEKTGLDRAALTQHTAIMRRRGVLVTRRTRDGLQFRVSDGRILSAFSLMRGIIVERIKRESELLSAVTDS